MRRVYRHRGRGRERRHRGETAENFPLVRDSVRDAGGGGCGDVLVMGVSTSARIVSGVTVGILGRVASESGNVRLPLYESEEAKANAKIKGDHRL